MDKLIKCRCRGVPKMISRIATSFVECQKCGVRTKIFSGRNDGFSFSSYEAERLATEAWNNLTSDKLVKHLD